MVMVAMTTRKEASLDSLQRYVQRNRLATTTTTTTSAWCLFWTLNWTTYHQHGWRKQNNSQRRWNSIRDLQDDAQEDSSNTTVQTDRSIGQLRPHSQWILLWSTSWCFCSNSQLLQVSRHPLLFRANFQTKQITNQYFLLSSLCSFQNSPCVLPTSIKRSDGLLGKCWRFNGVEKALTLLLLLIRPWLCQKLKTNFLSKHFLSLLFKVSIGNDAKKVPSSVWKKLIEERNKVTVLYNWNCLKA